MAKKSDSCYFNDWNKIHSTISVGASEVKTKLINELNNILHTNTHMKM